MVPVLTKSKANPSVTEEKRKWVFPLRLWWFVPLTKKWYRERLPPFLRGKNRRYISMAGPIPQKQNWGQVKYSRPSFLDTLASWAERAGADAEKLS
jgi:hypothetical protein